MTDDTYRFCIIDQCSGTKDHPDEATVHGIDDVDERRAAQFDADPDVTVTQAKDLYDGRQQNYIDDAVTQIRDAGHTVDRYFISAGFGLVYEEVPLPAYDVTFAEMSRSQIRERGRTLKLSNDIKQEIVDKPFYDVVFCPVGADYYRAMHPDEVVESVPKTTTVALFNQDGVADGRDRVISIDAGREEASEHGTTAIALKGHLLQHYADRLGLVDDPTDTETVAGLCLATNTEEDND